MFSDIKILAPAKVNLGLKVLPIRPDGFHNIESVFQTVSLYDTLTVSHFDGKGCVVEADGFKELPADNTLTRTYKAFCRLTGFNDGVRVVIEKHIPAGGGLGGGSSDAASFLKALARVSKIELTDSLADAVASQVGSDVFFFLHCGESKNACAVVTGRGESVKAIRGRDDLFFLLVFPQVHSSTKEAYGLLDELYNMGRFTSCPKLEELEEIYLRPVGNWTFANSFAPALLQKYPDIGLALRDLKNSGAPWADVSGSGATVFGVFDSKQDAENAYSLLKKNWIHCALVR